MARVENDTSDSDDNDEKITEGEDEHDLFDEDKDDSDDESITSEEEMDMSDLEQKVSFLEEKILDNPYDFKSHVDLLALLRQIGVRDRMRAAYERLRDTFPLEPSQWLSWLQMEGDSVTTPEGKENIYSLFQKAFQDCFCGGIYMEWCAMSLVNAEEAQKVLPEALEAAGADPLDGSLLWDTAKEFELNQLAIISSSSSSSAEECREKVDKLMSAYTNQLCRPLFRAEGILDEFRQFVDSHREYIVDVDERVAKIEEAHIKSEDILKGLMEFEYQLESIVGNSEEKVHERCVVYMKYLTYSKQLLIENPEPNLHNIKSLINVLYDRASSDCSAALCRLVLEISKEAEDICVDYVDFVASHFSLTECRKVIDRMIKRCPRSSRLWIRKIRHSEKMENSLDQIKNSFESSLYSGFNTADDYVAVWSCYLEILRRKTDFSSEEQVDRMRKTFRLAWDSLGQMWGNTADTEFTILQFWARIEYQHTKDYQYGRELFEEILMYPENRVHGGLWLEYINLEKMSGGVSRARTCYKRAIKSSGDPRLQRAWLNTERDHGTLDSLMECEVICAERAKEWEVQQQAIKDSKMSHMQKTFGKNKRQINSSGNNVKKQNSNKKNKGKASPIKQNAQDEHSRNMDSVDGLKHKRKFSDGGDILFSSPAKMKKDCKTDNTAEDTVGSSVKRKGDESGSPTKRLKSDVSEIIMGPPPGYPRDTNTTQTETDPQHYYQDEDAEKNSRTVFISNLDYLAKEEEVQSKLDSYGDVEEMRWAKGPYGRICYCVYKNNSGRDKAISRDRSPIGNRPMFISRYNPSKETRKKHFVYPTSVERNKLFVKNIPFDYCTKERLSGIFDKHGELKDIRIVTYKNGNPKGLAYVEYADDKSAAAALQATDGLDIAGRELSVNLSAPPPKKQEPQLGTVVPVPPSSSRGHSKTMLFVPSVVTQKTLSNVISKPSHNLSEKSVGNGSTTAFSTASKLSNSDFRNMLLKKT